MFKEDIETLVSKLENLFTTKTIVGEPIVSGNITIIPIVTASVGFGVGSGEGQDDEDNKGKGTGAGAGLKLKPTAILVIKGDDVEVYSLADRGSLAKVVEMVPDILSKITSKTEED